VTRAVIDTNVLVSALISGSGPPRVIYDAWEAGRFELVTAPALIAELVEVLSRDSIRRRYAVSADEVTAAVELLISAASILREPLAVLGVIGDPMDDLALACCLAASADYLVTGDGELQRLEKHGETLIVSPRQFISLIAQA
jgi:uncharacterized protein